MRLCNVFKSFRERSRRLLGAQRSEQRKKESREQQTVITLCCCAHNGNIRKLHATGLIRGVKCRYSCPRSPFFLKKVRVMCIYIVCVCVCNFGSAFLSRFALFNFERDRAFAPLLFAVFLMFVSAVLPVLFSGRVLSFEALC